MFLDLISHHRCARSDVRFGGIQHCQKLTPEYTKAAQSLSPLVDFYAVDCDADENKRLCAEQGIKGFPTIKVRIYPQSDMASAAYDDVRPGISHSLEGYQAQQRNTKESDQHRASSRGQMEKCQCV